MARTTSIIAVRHAQSEHHVNGLTGGWTDTPLTALGHEQSRLLAARLKDELAGERITLYTSDLLRASQTAGHIAEAFGVAAIEDARLREHNNGVAANMLFDEARATYPEAFDRAWRLEDRLLPGCESGREFYERVASFVDELEAVEGTIVVVTHGASMESFIGRWLRLAPEVIAGLGFAVYPASITELTRDRFGRPLLERMNDVAHLAALATIGQS